VDTLEADQALNGILSHITRTLGFRRGVGSVMLPVGFFANVVNLGNGAGLAISTDGVGTKALIAQALGKYDTIGIDCVAMNANDVLCVGAEPISLVDYIAVKEAEPRALTAIAKGLARGAEIANITISGGEIAQLSEMIHGDERGTAFDLAGTCIGVVPLDRIIVGKTIAPGDIIVGLRSSGVHSNGLTLARRVLFDRAGYTPATHLHELGRSIGEELLEPTRIYVREVLAMLRAGIELKGLAHITSDGFLNLCRMHTNVGYEIEYLPAPHPIFEVIQREGNVPDTEMFTAFNMGIGFCIIVAEDDVERVSLIAREHGSIPYRIGRTVADGDRRVTIRPNGLTGTDHVLERI
jgi:phosphoribosylformylglycinamidine cyclo-ligase